MADRTTRLRGSGFCSLILVCALGLASCHSESAIRHSPRATPKSQAGAPAPDVSYVNIAPRAGLDFSWRNHPPGAWTLLETAGAGCAFLDYDGDGWMDVFVAGNPRCALYHNNHDGTFTEVTDKAGITQQGHWIGVAVGDYDNDGREDLYVSGYHCGMLLHNNGDGTFKDVTQRAGLSETGWSTCCAFLDADGDGRLDLIVGHYVRFEKGTPQLCAFTLGIMAACGPQAYQAERPRLYHNNANGAFTDITKSAGLAASNGKNLAVKIWDYNNDGRPDIYLANDQEPGDLFKNLGGGHFKSVGAEAGIAFDTEGLSAAGMGADCADSSRDGRLDLAVSTFSGEVFQFYHNLGCLFSPTSMQNGLGATRPFLGWGCHFLDFNDDGWPDLIFATGHVRNNAEQTDPGATFKQKPLLFRNERGHFTLVKNGGSGLAAPIVGRGLAVGDVENDGSQDILLVDFEGSPLLLHNRRRGHNHWLGVALKGSRCNRDGYGARVTVRWSGQKSFADCNPSGSYASSSDPRLHFGLGPSVKNLNVSVRWPDGAESKVPNVEPDRYITVQESGRRRD